MTRTALTIAVALIAGTTLSNVANAGGVRLGFGFPLGSFVAKPFQGSSLGGGYGHKKSYKKPAYAARKAPRPAQVDVAETRPVKAKPAPVKTANVETKSTATDAPAVYIPDTPVKTEAAKTQNTAALTPQTAEQETEVKVDNSRNEKVEKVEAEQPTTEENSGKRVCRKFSAVVGGLVEAPCE